jgi:hypothetical protein
MNLSTQLITAFEPDYTIKVRGVSDHIRTDGLMERLKVTLTNYGYAFIPNEAGTVLLVKETKLK